MKLYDKHFRGMEVNPGTCRGNVFCTLSTMGSKQTDQHNVIQQHFKQSAGIYNPPTTKTPTSRSTNDTRSPFAKNTLSKFLAFSRRDPWAEWKLSQCVGNPMH